MSNRLIIPIPPVAYGLSVIALAKTRGATRGGDDAKIWHHLLFDRIWGWRIVKNDSSAPRFPTLLLREMVLILPQHAFA